MSSIVDSTKYVILTSGGADSATLLGEFVGAHGASNCFSLLIKYGQRHVKEVDAAYAVAQHYGVRHKTLNLSAVYKEMSNPLLAATGASAGAVEVPKGTYKAQEEKYGKLCKTYVPFRNGLFISAAAAIGLDHFSDAKDIKIVHGMHADDSVVNAYADCSHEFSEGMNKALQEGSYGIISLLTPYAQKTTKTEIIARGLEIGVPYELTYSCYSGTTPSCGTCATCLDRIAAFVANGVKDPIQYAEGTGTGD